VIQDRSSAVVVVTASMVPVVILTTYPQQDRVAVVIMIQDRHALGEA